MRTPADNQQTQKGVAMRLAASERSDKIPPDSQQTPEEQTSDDESRRLGQLKTKECELFFRVYKQEVYVHIDNATDKELRKLVLKKGGREETFKLSSGDDNFGYYLIENITESKMTDFIEGYKKSSKPHDITWS